MKILLGDALLAAGKGEEALRVYKEAQALAPEHSGLDAKIFEAESRQLLGSAR